MYGGASEVAETVVSKQHTGRILFQPILSQYNCRSEFSGNLDRVPLNNNFVGVENSFGFQFSWDL